ncbi:hypothetical protein F4776DRAFT_529468 [Hypoxylon sp. NC0597]|nr:hypothetical protein F4776DRAFT_529468 [Hypoxylon sp. NC0597]
MSESTTFRFTDLPPLLRIIVWKFCLPGPRNVTVMKGNRTPAPVIMHICRESRAIAQMYSYELAFPVANFNTEWLPREPDIVFESTPVIWFNFELDRLCLDSSWVDFQSCVENFRRLQSLGISYQYDGYCGDGLLGMFDDCIWESENLPGLKEVVLFGPRRDFWDVSSFGPEPPPNLTLDDELDWLACRLLGSKIGHMLSINMPPIRWDFSRSRYHCFGGPGSAPSAEAAYHYVFVCPTTGRAQIQKFTKEQLGWT